MNDEEHFHSKPTEIEECDSSNPSDKSQTIIPDIDHELGTPQLPSKDPDAQDLEQ